MNLKPISYFLDVYTTWFFIQKLLELVKSSSDKQLIFEKKLYQFGGKFEFSGYVAILLLTTALDFISENEYQTLFKVENLGVSLGNKMI